MKSTIDSAGRIVIPSAIRREAGFHAGIEVEIRFRAGVVELEPAAISVKKVRRGKLLVAIAEGSETLGEETVRKTREGVRKR